MKTREEKRWELMQEVLFAESRGDKPLRVSSQRTLFGIKSHVETVIDAVAEEDRKKCEDLIKSQRNNSDESACESSPESESADEQAAGRSADGQNPNAPADKQINESATTGKPAGEQMSPAKQTSAQTSNAIPNETSEA